ncbi:MAG: hypothetical protein ACOY3P_13930 [Planctomycetota bacterium]
MPAVCFALALLAASPPDAPLPPDIALHSSAHAALGEARAAQHIDMVPAPVVHQATHGVAWSGVVVPYQRAGHCRVKVDRSTPGMIPSPLGSWWKCDYLAYRGNYFGVSGFNYRRSFDNPWHDPLPLLAPRIPREIRPIPPEHDVPALLKMPTD